MKTTYRFLFLLLAIAAVACAPRVDNRGHVDKTGNLSKITPGQSHKQDVLRLLGSPSTTASFGQETWYYIAARKESLAFFKPEIAEQQVTRILFNGSGLVETVASYDASNRQDFETVEDYTPTEGQKLGLWEQMLGNFGRFNQPPADASER